MAYIIQPDYVRYECTCGSLKPISTLYFCRHCLKLRCTYCVKPEVDSHYCSNCLEHLPPSEAKLKKNRCTNCYDCPVCFNTLSVRATTRAAEDGSNTQSKHYYLACFVCRWTSRDVGIPDQTVAFGNWPVKEYPNAEQIQQLLEHYRIVALREKLMSEKAYSKTFSSPRRSYAMSDKLGYSAMMAKKRLGLTPLPLGGKEVNFENLPPIKPSVAIEEVDPLPESFLTEEPDLTKITSLKQRHNDIVDQPESVDDLHPQHKHFFVKRSFRCRECDHNVSKPEYNPGSIKFKIQLTANSHVMDVRIVTCEPLRAGKVSEITLKVTNPTQHLSSIQFSQLPSKEVEMALKEREKPLGDSKEDKKEQSEIKAVPPLSERIVINAISDLPQNSVVLPPRDDAAEYDDTVDTVPFQDDPKVVVWRKGNKAAVKFTVTPKSDLEPGTEVTFGFVLEYGYVNTMPTLEQKQPQRTEMQVKIYINPGSILGS